MEEVTINICSGSINKTKTVDIGTPGGRKVVLKYLKKGELNLVDNDGAVGVLTRLCKIYKDSGKIDKLIDIIEDYKLSAINQGRVETVIKNNVEIMKYSAFDAKDRELLDKQIANILTTRKSEEKIKRKKEMELGGKPKPIEDVDTTLAAIKQLKDDYLRNQQRNKMANMTLAVKDTNQNFNLEQKQQGIE